MIYALYSEGFRLGGSNSKKNPASRMPDRYENDSLVNKEVGLKSQWLDNRLQLNASFYTMEWDDIQRGITDPDDWSANATVNMGDAELSGAEITATFIVSERLSVDASYSTNDSELQNNYYLSELIALTDPDSQDYLLGANGQEMAIAPPSKWWLGIEYSLPEVINGIDGWIRYDHWWQEAMYHDWWSARDAMNSDPMVTGSKLIKDQGEANLQFDGSALDIYSSGAVTDNHVGLTFRQTGTYSDGRYEHRFRKKDEGGGLPLYIDKTSATANAHTAIARFGSYASNPEEFEVYGDMKADKVTANAMVLGGGNSNASIYRDGSYSGFHFTTNAIYPTAGTGQLNTGVVDLGSSSYKYKNLKS